MCRVEHTDSWNTRDYTRVNCSVETIRSIEANEKRINTPPSSIERNFITPRISIGETIKPNLKKLKGNANTTIYRLIQRNSYVHRSCPSSVERCALSWTICLVNSSRVKSFTSLFSRPSRRRRRRRGTR